MATKKVATAKKTKADPKKIVHDEFLTDDGKKATLVTEDGYKKLVEELDFLKTGKRQQVAERLKEAISYGDLSENSEYEEAKNEQAFVEGRILELEEKVKNAKIISAEHHKDGRTVQLGTTVHLKNLSTKSGDVEVYTIVGSTEADPFGATISNESPVGSALLDRKKGDKVSIQVPGGVVEYEILKMV